MKATHRQDIFAYSSFDASRNLDFNTYLLVREGGNVLVDPLPMSEHDRAHLTALGGAKWIVVTNSDHTRASQTLASELQASLVGPAAERETLGLECARWLTDGETWLPGIEVLALAGSKTPGELALIVDGTTLITGDLVRAHVGGSLTILPDPKLADKAQAIASVRRLAARTEIDAVLVGDGWPVFRGGHACLAELAARLG